MLRGGNSHSHSLTHTQAAAETCTEDGNKEYWYCADCGKYYSDEDAATEITLADTVIAATGHTLTHVTATAATCTATGNTEYWHCTTCGKYYSDANAANQISLSDTVTKATGHTASTYTSYDKTNHYYTCTDCGESITEAHNYENGICACGYEEGTSVGLAYTAVYDADDDTKIVSYTLSGIGDCTDTEIVIPSTYNYISVTAIAASAFADNTIITAVTIPDSITSIGMKAFYGCSGLAAVTLGDESSLTTISSQAFSGCSALTSITIPKNVKTLGSYAYYNCTALTQVYYNATAVNDFSSSNLVFDYAGQSGDGITLTIGANVESLPAFLFSCAYEAQIPKLVAITFDDIANSKLTSIGGSAFYRATNLTTVDLPASLTTIGSSAFSACTALTKVTYYGTPSQWASISFSNITSNPLYYAGNLYLNEVLATDITLDNVTSISSFAFYKCTSLTSVTIGGDVTSINNNAFYGCTSLSTVTFENTSGWYVTTTSGAESGDTVDVATSTSDNATYLKTTYYTYYWYRSVS